MGGGLLNVDLEHGEWLRKATVVGVRREDVEEATTSARRTYSDSRKLSNRSAVAVRVRIAQSLAASEIIPSVPTDDPLYSARPTIGALQIYEALLMR